MTSFQRGRLVRAQLSSFDRAARARDEVEHEAQIMQSQQPVAEQLLLVDEVT